MQNTNNTKGGLQLKRAVKEQGRLRMGISGPAGSGKTWTALTIATELVPGQRVAVLDTELGSASKYADHFDFDVVEVDHYAPKVVLEFIELAVAEGYGAVVVDGVSPFWNGPGGFLEMVDEEVARQRSRGGKGDSFAAWKPVDAAYSRWVTRILQSPIHIIMTMRAKMAYEKTENEKGKAQVVKLGLAPIFRDTFSYEFDVMLDMDQDHTGIVSKTRVHGLDDSVHRKPGKALAARLKDWLQSGVQATPPAEAAPPADATRSAEAGGPEAREVEAAKQATQGKAAQGKATREPPPPTEDWLKLKGGFEKSLGGLNPQVSLVDLDRWHREAYECGLNQLNAATLRRLFGDLRDGVADYWEWAREQGAKGNGAAAK